MMCVAIIQVRSSSKRLKNKAMKMINSKPVLYYVYNRVAKSKKIKKIIVACSDRRSDDKIFSYCKSQDYLVERGSLNNVVQRFQKIIKKHKLRYFIRINGDSPCMDPNVINNVHKIFLKNKCDLATNVFPRSYPKGLSVEVIKSSIFNNLKNKKLNSFNKEHITSYFYQNSLNYKISNTKNSKNYSKKSLALDTKNDFIKLKPILMKKNFIKLGWRNILNRKYNI